MTTTTHTCPSLEEIAALLDGKLGGEDRARVIQHLDECPDCFEVFAGTAHFLEEDSRGTQRGRLLSFPFVSRPEVRRWLPAAAAVLVTASLAIPAYVTYVAPPEVEVAALLEPLRGTPGLQNHLFEWSTYRGAGDESNEVIPASFMVGAWLVDRQVSLDGDRADLATATDLSRRIWLALEARGFMEEQARAYKSDWEQYQAIEDQRDKAEQHARVAALLREMQLSMLEREASLAGDTSSLAREYLDFGKWTEAARLAAAANRPEFFQQRGNHRFARYFLAKEGENLDPEVRRNLEAVVAQWDERKLPVLRAKLHATVQTYESLYDAGVASADLRQVLPGTRPDRQAPPEAQPPAPPEIHLRPYLAENVLPPIPELCDAVHSHLELPERPSLAPENALAVTKKQGQVGRRGSC